MNAASSGKFIPAGTAPVYWVVGNQITFSAVANDTGGAYTLFDITVPRGSGTPPHVHHREDEAFYILSGEIALTVGDQTRSLTAGDFAHAPRDVPHHYQALSNVQMLVMAIPSGLEDFFAAVGRPITKDQPPPDAPTEDDIQRLLAAAGKFGLEILLPPPE